MSSLLVTGLPPAVLQPFLRQLKDHTVNAVLEYLLSASSEGERQEERSAPF